MTNSGRHPEGFRIIRCTRRKRIGINIALMTIRQPSVSATISNNVRLSWPEPINHAYAMFYVVESHFLYLAV